MIAKKVVAEALLFNFAYVARNQPVFIVIEANICVHAIGYAINNKSFILAQVLQQGFNTKVIRMVWHKFNNFLCWVKSAD
jgi:hypothetical protein